MIGDGRLKELLLVVGVAGAMLAAGAPAKQPTVDERVWIVELDDAPTVEFDGSSGDTVTAHGSAAGKTLAATAPSVTGARRLDPDAPAVRAYVAHLDDRRDRVLDRVAAELGREIEPKFVYRHLMNGFAARMSAGEARRLAALPGVRSVQPDIIQYLQSDAGPQWIGAPAVWDGTNGVDSPNEGEGTVLGVVDSGVNWESIFFDLSQSNTQVTNPRGEFLGLCNDEELDIPCSAKLIGVYDFTDEGTDGFDPDGHGSHTSSTAVGLPLSFNLDFGSGDIPFETSGVAPRASFISYKACQAPEDSAAGNFECPGSATTAALEQAIEDGVDALNFSIGGDPFDPWSPNGNQRTFLNMRAAGIVPLVSAGNSGPGDRTVGSPANTPWVVAVANAHHGRVLANRVVNTSGGPFALGNLVGEGITDGTTTLPIVHARDFGNALCGTGEAELGPNCGDNTGASNPFDPGTFDGQIVVCDRGTYGRVEKGKNVELAGAAGMILANTAGSVAETGDTVSGDQHCLPATHINRADGDRLRDWLASGSGHRGRLTGTERFVDDRRTGRLASSSSRGPADGAPDVMKPNVTAPGTSVLAAGSETDEDGTGPGDNAANQVLFLNGTSMSAPHVSGAALLLRAAHPEWGVDEVISALETTAVPGKVTNGDDSEARVVDRGAGGVRVDLASRIGLFLPVEQQEFLDANPGSPSPGDPGALNLPGVFSENCVETCRFTRRVEGLGAGTWNVSTEGELGITVSPSTFSLAAGERQTLEITVTADQVPFGQWGAGSIVLASSNPAFVTQRLPVGAKVSAGDLPESVAFESQTNRGRAALEIPSVAAVSELVVRTSELKRPESRNVTLEQDPTRDEPFDDDQGTHTELFEVPDGALLLYAETFQSSAVDVDLFVGRDDNGNGRADEFEARCSSTSPDELETCRIARPDAGTWWVRVQLWESNGPSDPVLFDFAAFAEQPDPSLVSFGPGVHDGGALTLPVFWDQPAMLEDERWTGVISLASSPDFFDNIGTVLVDVKRTGTNEPAETALFNDQAYPVVVPSGATHDRLYIDLPAASKLNVTVDGELSNVTVRRRDFDELVATVPQTPPAPAEVLVTASRDGNQWTAELEDLAGGRYFVVLENDGPLETSSVVTASVEIARVGTPPPEELMRGRGLWSPEARAINQGVDFQAGGGGRFAVWYTYDEDGSPTFYITDTVPGDGTFFSAVLFRATSNDERSSLKAVGEVQITRIDRNRFMYAWRLNGNHGAEMFDPVSVGGGTCPTIPEIGDEPVPLLGHWFSPDSAAGGVTLLITDSTEAWVRYYYDDANEPRWAIADVELPPTLPGGNRMEVLDFRGWCIYCEEGPITNEVVGTLERVFIGPETVREASDFLAGPPLDSNVQNDRELKPISNPVSCPN